MQAKVGDRFTINVADSVVLMEVVGLRCGDVWNCEPVPGEGYADEYGRHMVLTDDQAARKIRSFSRRQAPRRPAAGRPAKRNVGPTEAAVRRALLSLWMELNDGEDCVPIPSVRVLDIAKRDISLISERAVQLVGRKAAKGESQFSIGEGPWCELGDGIHFTYDRGLFRFKGAFARSACRTQGSRPSRV